MRCPWCAFAGGPRAVHAHLSGVHPEQVRVEERGSRRFYSIECPVCGAGYDHEVKPRLRDPEFMQQFQSEIRMVAFDMLVNHLLVEHEPDTDDPGTDDRGTDDPGTDDPDAGEEAG